MWQPTARDELAVLWMAADSAVREGITVAANRVDDELRQHPENKGESRPNNQRIFFVFPLAIRFRIDTPRSIVYVTHVWTYRRS